jgi:psp operon transcriptional activator
MDGWPGFSTEAMARLQAYDWPGNVRELRNVVERAVYRWAGQEGPIEDIQFDPFESPWRPVAGQGVLGAPAFAPQPADETALALPPAQVSAHRPDDCADFRLAIAEYEKAILTTALERCRWNQRAAAAALSLTYDQLRHAMRRHELQG